ncbi:hypothetical protein GCM10025881_25150 [Pseudolysinimonas kribbensis]|uniref:Uncharacterized protein n=1 Tax=Pseudolysinimonas kribbensis TaxID=433641 RepID=A0ABQ6KAJ9_9MICO|nr:hypothetical protein GCM10025881_25150 [Pseudolysinimonas kribbensis]
MAPDAREHRELPGAEVDVADLAGRVHAHVGAAGDGHAGRRTGRGEQRGEALLELPCTVRSPGWRAHPEKPVPS